MDAFEHGGTTMLQGTPGDVLLQYISRAFGESLEAPERPDGYQQRRNSMRRTLGHAFCIK